MNRGFLHRQLALTATVIVLLTATLTGVAIVSSERVLVRDLRSAGRMLTASMTSEVAESLAQVEYPSIRNQADALRRTVPGFESLAVGDLTGRVVVHTDRRFEGRSWTEAGGWAGGVGALSERVVRQGSGRMFEFAAPLVSRGSGAQAGMLRLVFNDGVVRQESRRIGLRSALAGAAAMVLSLAVVVLFARRDARRLEHVATGIEAGAGKVSTSSARFNAESRVLSSGASEQAAFVEAATAAMEEMAAMTRRTAGTADAARALAATGSGMVGEASEAMSSLSEAMRKVSARGEEIGRIIRAIDEVAYMTNLLALNAAVEAARAGEAGAGFAVVADEVRNLALRAAGAAKDTGALIEETMGDIREGRRLVERTASEFVGLADAVRAVADHVDGISRASAEQADGIAGVTAALSRMDGVTQRNAGFAAEISVSSEGLMDEAIRLEEAVASIRTFLHGGQTAWGEGAPADAVNPPALASA